jgi:hypothetical protein
MQHLQSELQRAPRIATRATHLPRLMARGYVGACVFLQARNHRNQIVVQLDGDTPERKVADVLREEFAHPNKHLESSVLTIVHVLNPPLRKNRLKVSHVAIVWDREVSVFLAG